MRPGAHDDRAAPGRLVALDFRQRGGEILSDAPESTWSVGTP
jgi:hypothetical protein